MKKIFFSTKGKADGKLPFWHPWGLGGCLGRLLLFVLLLLILLFLLSMFRRCDGSFFSDVPNDTELRGDAPFTPVPIDTTVGGGDMNNIPDPGEFLPDSAHNRVPPYDDRDVTTDSVSRRSVVTNKLNVILDSEANNDTYRQWAREFKENYPDSAYKILYYHPLTKLIQIGIPAERREALVTELPKKITDIKFKVFMEELFSVAAARPNDLVFKDPDKSWFFPQIQAFEAWDITRGSENVVVAIVDSFFDVYHEDLNSTRIVKPYSVPRHSGNVMPPPLNQTSEVPFIHGTMVASMAVGNQNNGTGTSGIAPGCKFMPVSVGDECTSMTLLEGLLYAIYQGANVINISMGSSYPDFVQQVLRSFTPADMARYNREQLTYSYDIWDYVASLCEERNVTVVWAAGNDALFMGCDPSKRGDKWIKVSAIDRNLRMASFSNFGNFPEVGLHESTVSAPGVDIVGAFPFTNNYAALEGTSFSAPLVTGAVALMRSVDPEIKTADIIKILKETGKPVQGCPQIGPNIQIKDALMAVRARRSA
ncbi:MAG: S8 family serine peptidase [Alloprevotella sp.]|nr:S8 family serine peptidase [Alloprevotella sp.]